MSKYWGLHFSWKKPPEAAYPGAHGFYPPKLSHPKLPRKMRPRNIFGHFLSKNDQKSLKIWPGWHVQNLGVAFFLEKNRRRQPTPEHMGFLSGKIQDGLHGMASWQGPILAKHGFGTDWAPYGSKWSFDRLPEQEISRRIS